MGLDIPEVGNYTINKLIKSMAWMVKKMYKHLKEIRVKKGLTLMDMSSILGYSSPNAYARKEKGERKFTLEEVEKISNFFGMTIEQIFLDSQSP